MFTSNKSFVNEKLILSDGNGCKSLCLDLVAKKHMGDQKNSCQISYNLWILEHHMISPLFLCSRKRTQKKFAKKSPFLIAPCIQWPNFILCVFGSLLSHKDTVELKHTDPILIVQSGRTHVISDNPAGISRATPVRLSLAASRFN